MTFVCCRSEFAKSVAYHVLTDEYRNMLSAIALRLCPTISGKIVEALDHVFTTFFSLAAFSVQFFHKTLFNERLHFLSDLPIKSSSFQSISKLNIYYLAFSSLNDELVSSVLSLSCLKTKCWFTPGVTECRTTDW